MGGSTQSTWGTHPIFESDFDCLTDDMLLLLSVLVHFAIGSRYGSVHEDADTAKLQMDEVQIDYKVVNACLIGAAIGLVILGSLGSLKVIQRNFETIKIILLLQIPLILLYLYDQGYLNISTRRSQYNYQRRNNYNQRRNSWW